MKQILFLFILCVLFAGCRTPQKITSHTMETVISNEKQNEATSSETYNFADMTKKQDVEINYFHIEFYPPTVPTEPDTIPDNSTFPENPLGNMGNSNPKKPPDNKGAIKSIEGYTVKAKGEQSGVSESKKNTQTNQDTEKNNVINKQAETKEQPAPDPYRWRYILGICIAVVLAGIGLYFGLQKTKAVKAIVTFFKKIFQFLFVHK
jgi:hypothetical protein